MRAGARSQRPGPEPARLCRSPWTIIRSIRSSRTGRRRHMTLQSGITRAWCIRRPNIQGVYRKGHQHGGHGAKSEGEKKASN